MNLTSFLANKCFEYLLKCDTAPQDESGQSRVQPLSSSQFSIQPPWSFNKEIFRSLCDGCGHCISACENNILILNKKGYPQVDFSLGSCSFCGACATSCPRKAFIWDPSRPPWDLHVEINSRCLTKNNVICNTCVEQCDKEAIVIPTIMAKDKSPRVLRDSCNGCGACLKACPVQAIEIYYPEHQE